MTSTPSTTFTPADFSSYERALEDPSAPPAVREYASRRIAYMDYINRKERDPATAGTHSEWQAFQAGVRWQAVRPAAPEPSAPGAPLLTPEDC